MSQYPSTNDIRCREEKMIMARERKIMNERKNALHSTVMDSPNESNNEDCNSSNGTSDAPNG